VSRPDVVSGTTKRLLEEQKSGPTAVARDARLGDVRSETGPSSLPTTQLEGIGVPGGTGSAATGSPRRVARRRVGTLRGYPFPRVIRGGRGSSRLEGRGERPSGSPARGFPCRAARVEATRW